MPPFVRPISGWDRISSALYTITWYLLALPSEFKAGFALFPLNRMLGLYRIHELRQLNHFAYNSLLYDSLSSEQQRIHIVCHYGIEDPDSVQVS